MAGMLLCVCCLACGMHISKKCAIMYISMMSVGAAHLWAAELTKWIKPSELIMLTDSVGLVEVVGYAVVLPFGQTFICNLHTACSTTRGCRGVGGGCVPWE